MLANIYSFW